MPVPACSPWTCRAPSRPTTPIAAVRRATSCVGGRSVAARSARLLRRRDRAGDDPAYAFAGRSHRGAREKRPAWRARGGRPLPPLATRQAAASRGDPARHPPAGPRPAAAAHVAACDRRPRSRSAARSPHALEAWPGCRPAQGRLAPPVTALRLLRELLSRARRAPRRMGSARHSRQPDRPLQARAHGFRARGGASARPGSTSSTPDRRQRRRGPGAPAGRPVESGRTCRPLTSPTPR